jgi:hypothetical protein
MLACLTTQPQLVFLFYPQQVVDRTGQTTDNTFLTADEQAGREEDQDQTFPTEKDIFHYLIL